VASELGLLVLEAEPKGARAGRFDLQPSPVGPLPSARFSSAQDVGLLLHTSGTTARPKLVPLTHANLLASARSNAAVLQLGPTDRSLGVMPLFHVGGLVSTLLTTLSTGGSVVCTAGFREHAFFDWVAEFEPTWFTGGPTIHDAILAQAEQYRRKAPLHRFRFVRSASAPLPTATMARLAALYEAPVSEAYGMTEAGRIASNPLPPGRSKIGTVGRAVAGCEIAIRSEDGTPLPTGTTGEIVVRGESVAAGYANDPVTTAAAFVDGWFRTGDLGRLDEEGYLTIEGRLKEIVNRGGQKIAPREIDEVLHHHPDVAQAVAFGVPHPTLGEDLVAAVVLRRGAQSDEPALRAFLFERLSAHKVPTQIALLDALPKGPTGKVQRYTLRELLSPLLRPSFVAAQTATEQRVEAVCREVLRCAPMGRNDNFFAVGGDSLRATQVMSRLNAQFGTTLPVVTLFRHPAIEQLANVLDQALVARDSHRAALVAEIDGLSDAEVDRQLAEEESRGVQAAALDR
jgi:acyl-CoA synthetase (AMP-forming)/AMP-acid ligase II/aryl carrier-like protein